MHAPSSKMPLCGEPREMRACLCVGVPGKRIAPQRTSRRSADWAHVYMFFFEEYGERCEEGEDSERCQVPEKSEAEMRRQAPREHCVRTTYIDTQGGEGRATDEG